MNIYNESQQFSKRSMRHKRKSFMADYSIIDGKYFFCYDASNGSCFGNDSKQTYIIKDIDAKTLFTTLGIKDESGLKWALDRLPDADNDIIRLKEFCDENSISYYYKMED